MAANLKPTGVVSNRDSTGSSSDLQSPPAETRQATSRPGFFQRKRNVVIASVVAAVILLGLILGLALGLTIGRRDSSSDGDNNASDHGDSFSDTGGPLGVPATGTHPNPEPFNGTIPNNANYTTLDPTLIRRSSDGTYFLYTTGAYSGIVWTSPSLRGPWTKSPEPLVELGTQAGAPDVHQFNESTYIMFYNSHQYNYSSEAGVTNPQAQMIWHDASIIARVSENCEPGSWKEVGRVDVNWQQKWNVLDPSLLSVPKGRGAAGDAAEALLTFGSYQTGLYQIPLDPDFPVQVAASPAAAGEKERREEKGKSASTASNAYAMSQVVHLEHNQTNKADTTEASYMYYRNFDNDTSTTASTSGSNSTATGGWYYLFFSSGKCCPQATNPVSLPHPHHGGGNNTAELVAAQPITYTVSGPVTTYPNTTISWFPYDQAYKIMVCRSRDARGEYFDRDGRSCLTDSGGTLVLGSHDEVFAPGGQGVWDDPVEGAVLYYHYVVFDTTTNRPNLDDKGYKFGWNKLDFSDEGWPTVVPT